MNKYFFRSLVLGLSITFGSSFTLAYFSSDCDIADDLATEGVVYSESNCRDYNLDRTIYRQEVAAIALRVAEKCGEIDDIPELNDYRCQNIFYDVTSTRPNSWACRSVEILADNDIITTVRRDNLGRTLFQPMKDISRSEALAMIMNSAGFDFQGSRYDDWRFTGTGAVAWQKALMQYADDNDIISSISSFGPNTIAYRREVFSYAQKSIDNCENNGDSDSSSNNDDTDNFYLSTDDSSPDTNDWVDLTIRARDGSSTDTGYRGGVEFDVYYRSGSSSSWIKTTSSSYYEIDNDYDNGYTFTSSNKGQKTLNNFIRFKKDDYEYKVVVTDEDDSDIEGYKVFDVGSSSSSNNDDTDNFYLSTDDSSPDTNDWVDLTIRARDGSSTDTSYRGDVEFDVYYRSSSSSSWIKTTSSSYYEIDNDYDDGYTFTSSNRGQKTLNNFIRFKKDDYEYKVVVTDEDDSDIEGYKVFDVGSSSSSNNDADNFYVTTDDSSPDTNDWVDLTIRARDGSYTDTSYRGGVEFDIYYRRSSSSSWTKTTSTSYYEIDEDYEDGYTFTSSNNGQKTLNNFIRFKKDDYEYKVVITDEDDSDIEGYKVFTVGNSNNNDSEETDNFYLNTNNSLPDIYDWVDLTIRARDGSYTDSSYRGTINFDVYYRRSGSSSWVKTTSSSYYEIDNDYDDEYSFSSSDDGEITLDNFIQFKKDDYEYKVVVTDEDDSDIEGYKIFRVGDYTSSDCGLGEYESGGNCYTCTGRPSNAYYEVEGNCDWTCASGYIERNGSCEYSTQLCGIGQYSSGNSCYNCNTKPSSGYYTNYGTCDWSCNSGYYRNGETCVSGTATCGIGQIANGNSCQSCVSAPANSYYTTAGSCSWTCNANYYSSGNQCLPYTQNCGVGQQLSGNICINCANKPINSIYSQSGTCDWVCDVGYTKDGNSCTPTQSYTWYQGTWNTCNATCGGGSQNRIVECRSTLTGLAVESWRCTGTMPTTSQSCNTHSCNTNTYSWKEGNWGTCQSGVQDRTVLCERNDGNIVSNSYCDNWTKPATSQSCNTSTYSWSTGTWGTCTNNQQTRTVVCKNNNNTTVADSYCSGSKPATTQNCSSGTYSWYRGNPNTCGITCSTTRTVVCQDNAGQTVADSYCSTSKPSHVCSRSLAWIDNDDTKSCHTLCNENNSCWVEDESLQACASGERIPTWGTFDFLYGTITHPTNLGGYYIYEKDSRFYCYGKTQTRDYNATDKVVACLCQ